MKLSGGLSIAAPAERVWDLIVDPLALTSCIPGVGDVRQVDERTFEGSVAAAVGPVHGEFDFTATLTGRTFPDLVVILDGVDSVTKSRLSATVAATIAADLAAGVCLDYEATVLVKGRLAILGEMILRATAGAMIAELTRCLRDRLEKDEEGRAAERPTDPAP